MTAIIFGSFGPRGSTMSVPQQAEHHGQRLGGIGLASITESVGV
jgi:hypothetical protein